MPATRPGSLRWQLCQTRERGHTPVTPATDAGASGSVRKSQQSPVFVGAFICSL